MDFKWKKEVHMRKGRGRSGLELHTPLFKEPPQTQASHLYHMLEGEWALQPNCPRPVLALIYGITLGKLLSLKLNK